MIVRRRSKKFTFPPDYSEIAIDTIFSGIGTTLKEKQTLERTATKEKINVHSQHVN